jgi:hypothetical protein
VVNTSYIASAIILDILLLDREYATRAASSEKGGDRVRCTKTFSALVLGAFVAGMGLVAVSAVVGSEFIRGLGVFPLLLAMFLLPHALWEWEASAAVRLGSRPTDEGAHLGPSAAAAEAATAARP